MFTRGLICYRCGARFTTREEVWACKSCGSILDVIYDYEGIRERLDRKDIALKPRGMERYSELLPLGREGMVSLGEGWTPIMRAGRYRDRVGVKDLLLKLEFLNPTGSFKDRGSAVLVSKAREIGVKALVDDSSGNAGSSLAAYSAKAGIECLIYVPTYTPEEKLVQMRIYGARIVTISGPRERVTQEAEKTCIREGFYYGGHNKNPYFLEGNKTFAYEIAEQLGWRMPGHIVIPVGGGSLFLGAWKGFTEFKRLGWIHDIPRLHCIQSMACKPLVDAYQDGLDHVEGVEAGETIAGGVKVGRPPRGDLILKALREGGGTALAVDDKDILSHQRNLARDEGIFAEPTSCTALSGLEALLEMGIIAWDEAVVVPITGFGLKDQGTAKRQLSIKG